MKSIMNFRLAPMAASMVLMANRCKASRDNAKGMPGQILDLTGQTKNWITPTDYTEVLDLTGAPARPKAHGGSSGIISNDDLLHDQDLSRLESLKNERDNLVVQMAVRQNDEDFQPLRKRAECKLKQLEDIIKQIEATQASQLPDETISAPPADEPMILCEHCGILTDRHGNHVAGTSKCTKKPDDDTVRHLKEIRDATKKGRGRHRQAKKSTRKAHTASRKPKHKCTAPSGEDCVTKQIFDELNAKFEEEKEKGTFKGKKDVQRCTWLRKTFQSIYCAYAERLTTSVICCAPVSFCYHFVTNCERLGKACARGCGEDEEVCKCKPECFPNAKKKSCAPASCFCWWDKEEDRIECHNDFVDGVVCCMDGTPGCLATTGKGIGHCLWNFTVRTPMKLVCIPYKTWKLCKQAHDSPRSFLDACCQMMENRAAQEPDQGCCTNDNCEKGCRCFWQESCGWCWCCCVVTGEAGEMIEGCAAMAELCKLLAICPGN